MHEDINVTEKVHDPKHGSESGLCPMTQILGDYQHWLSIDGSKFVPVSVASVASTSSQRSQQKFYLETRTHRVKAQVWSLVSGHTGYKEKPAGSSTFPGRGYLF